MREHLLGLLPPWLDLEAATDEAYFFASTRREDAPLVVLAGHYDTVPAQGNVPGRIENDTVHGLGASDMKGGLAVAIELMRDVEPNAGPYDLGLLLFGREELGADANPLPALFAESRSLHDAELAILLEPTDLRIQAGCLGNLVGRLTFHGRSGHSARPWLAESAVEKAARGLLPFFDAEPRVAVVGGLEYREVVSVTRLVSGIADNVIPGEAVATLNFRYAPDREPEAAERHLHALVPEGAVLELTSHAPAGRVVTDSRLVRALRASGDLGLEPKQAWTNVADFGTHGVDAVNFGPGHTAYAHRRDEQVDVGALASAYEILRRFLGGPMREDAF